MSLKLFISITIIPITLMQIKDTGEETQKNVNMELGEVDHAQRGEVRKLLYCNIW